MKLNKGFLALYGGIALGFFVLATLYFLFGAATMTKTDVAILFSIASALCASFAVLYESQRKKNSVKKCTNDDTAATFYVP
ncbi:MAG: hypothetical protein H9535_07380 [Ignavibacteria bacterium]|nr:hypothetical protein [Ignavibacteria bacterium]